MTAYNGTDYPKGTKVVLIGKPGEIVAVGRNGNYVVKLDSGNVAAHHSQLELVEEESDVIEVTVDTVRTAPHDGPGPSTVAIGEGVTDTGERITFVGEYNPMVNLYVAIEAGESPVVHLEPYQIIGRS